MPKGSTRPMATCHPEREHCARGMCQSCYTMQWRRENPEKVAARVKRPAPCHPDRPVFSNDLCSTCYRRKWRTENRDREREYSRTHQRKRAAERTPREKFERTIYKYGLTFDDYSALVVEQSGRCAACDIATPNLEVDHCHARGMRHVRGLLCHNCNSALGHARDDATRLQRLIGYLAATSVPESATLEQVQGDPVTAAS